MKLVSKIGYIILSFVLLAHAEARVIMGAVGTHILRVAEPGQDSQLISLPFLRTAVSLGRLDGVDANAESLTDIQGAFNKLREDRSYILRITDGPQVGVWFILDATSVGADFVRVLDDGLAGYLIDLSGGEAFSVHELFTLKELFPENSVLLPASSIDANSMQVHFYDGNGFREFWLSNGGITDHVGWTYTDEGQLKYAGDTAILPGTSFLVFYPNPSVAVDVRLQGVVLNEPLNIPIYPGYNFVSVHYSHRFSEDGGDLDPRLNHMGLEESGFRSTKSKAVGDLVISFDPFNGKLGTHYYLDSKTDVFRPVEDSVDPTSIGLLAKPGNGFVIFNDGDSYLWNYAN